MATRPLTPPVSLAPSKRSTRTLPPRRKPRTTARRSIPGIPVYPPSVRIAGGAIKLSPAVPTRFGNPVGKHHIIFGKWARDQLADIGRVSESRFCHLVETAFIEAVEKILEPVEINDLSVMVLLSENSDKPAVVIANKSQGQIELGWIEENESVPTEWRQTAYQAIITHLQPIIPAITFDDMFEELSMHYWDGSTNDQEARDALIELHCYEPEDLEGMTLPSHVEAKTPAWMRSKEMPGPARPIHPELAKLLGDIEQASRRFEKAKKKADPFAITDFETLCEYAPWYEEAYSLPPVTLVPVDIFACEIDDAARGGMEQGFLDACGLWEIDPASPDIIDHWLTTLRAGVEVLTAIQRLTAWDPGE